MLIERERKNLKRLSIFSDILDEEDPWYKPVGLQNIGNTCYM
jgi:ubiquitin C-terminal hydrolase